jgi:hypothetical protein
MRGDPFLEVSLTRAEQPDHGKSLRAALASTQWRRPDLRLTSVPPSAELPARTQDSQSGHDPLLTEIEDLVAELKAKVARYSLLRSDPSLAATTSLPDNRSAAEWMHEALEDIAATALGIELASQERMFRAIAEADRRTLSQTNQEPTSGTAG